MESCTVRDHSSLRITIHRSPSILTRGHLFCRKQADESKRRSTKTNDTRSSFQSAEFFTPSLDVIE